MSDFVLTKPVAFIIFNRPDTTAKVFAEIAKARPSKLLIVGDGPRTSRVGEVDRVNQARAVIDQVDWPCEVLTNFSETNLGCRDRVSSGLDWVFNQVEEAIILEDDCLPNPSFFRFCEEMLDFYRDDTRVGMISGDNFQYGRRYGNDSYYFSKYFHIWGWASWRDRWQGIYDVSLNQWPLIRGEGRVADLVLDDGEVSYWEKIFELVYQKKIDTWDYQWVFANWLEGRMAINPTVNLISNIGFGPDATHTSVISTMANLTASSMLFPMTHPKAIVRNRFADRYFASHHLHISLWRKVQKILVGKFRQLQNKSS